MSALGEYIFRIGLRRFATTPNTEYICSQLDYNIHLFLFLKTFGGNEDKNEEKKNILYEGILTRWLRFVGKTMRSKFCMRTEVFGVKKYPG